MVYNFGDQIVKRQCGFCLAHPISLITWSRGSQLPRCDWPMERPHDEELRSPANMLQLKNWTL